MGMMSFQLPARLADDAAKELERACVTGGPDNIPWPTQVHIDKGLLTLRRDVDESGALVVPWEIARAGRLMGSTGTLIERDAPYHFLVELARGKIHQLRCQSADWQANGLQLAAELHEEIRAAGQAFSQAVTHPPSEQAGREAQKALELGYRTSEQLVRTYIEQMFHTRHLRQPTLATKLGCRLGSAPLTPAQSAALANACNSACLTFSWHEVEPTEGDYNWEPYDSLLNWAEGQGLHVVAGPLIDFSSDRLPDWLWLWERDLTSLANFMCDYVEKVVRRYQTRIRSWHLTAASNFAALLGLGEDELLWLTTRVAEAALQIDPKLEVMIGVSQPWGEYMAVEDRTHSPLVFADTIVRSGLTVAGLDVELVMGVSPRGSYCRDLLEVSRLLDLYTLLGLPLRVTLGYPSSAHPDPLSGKDYSPRAGQWHGGYSPAVQADWARDVAGLAICKAVVHDVFWVDCADAQAHQFPHCGLFDESDQPKPALKRLHDLREKHLR